MCEKSDVVIEFVPVKYNGSVYQAHTGHSYMIMGLVASTTYDFLVPIKTTNFLSNAHRMRNPHQWWLSKIYNRQVSKFDTIPNAAETGQIIGMTVDVSPIKSGTFFPIEQVKFIEENDMYTERTIDVSDIYATGFIDISSIAYVVIAVCKKKDG
ncbi:MAG: hypothetical protein V4613_03585 [Bacteroidota bacterium]